MNNEQQMNDRAWALISEMSDIIQERVEFLQSDVEPDVPDTHEPHDDDYVPSMHNDYAGGGRRFPNLDQRWLAIGTTDLQKGLMALRKACEGGF